MCIYFSWSKLHSQMCPCDLDHSKFAFRGVVFALIMYSKVTWPRRPMASCTQSKFKKNIVSAQNQNKQRFLNETLKTPWRAMLQQLQTKGRRKGTRLSPREFGQSLAPFSGLVRPAVYSPDVLAWDGKGLLKLIYVYYGIREKLSP